MGILKDAGIDPAPERSATTWAGFLRSQAEGLLACDFLETVTLTGARMYVLAVIEHHTRRIRVLGATAHPTAAWVTQAARNRVMDLEDAGCRALFLIRDRDGKFPDLFGAVLADAGIRVVLTGVRMPRMNAVMERWVQTSRRELLDRTLIWNQRHPLHALREFGEPLQRTPPAPRHRQHTPAEAAASTDHRTRPNRPPGHPTKATSGRNTQRVRTRCLTCADVVSAGCSEMVGAVSLKGIVRSRTHASPSSAEAIMFKSRGRIGSDRPGP
ncbi:hypothetical protein [Actinomadura soli]|uniref:hypothetical protein n=1 Tax=Actinomadura soli TaxID=2508997 RepID=UPI00197AE5EB|nr:hypothetical protein [Actinomadura soli]